VESALIENPAHRFARTPARHTPVVAGNDQQQEPERHATWIELFFDVVAVAGVSQLAHLLGHGPSLADIGLYVLLFLAFWIAWAAFTVYGSVTGDRARIGNILLAMLGLAVMVAAVPGVRDRHTDAFVVAYVALRWLAGLVYQRGSVVVDWPLAQYGAGALPWIVSLFVPEVARYWLWSAGIVIDLAAMLAADGSEMLQNAQRKFDRMLRARQAYADQPGHPGRPGPGRIDVTITAAHADVAHLAERMGLFVIIVLGEGVVQVLTAASGADWDVPLDATALGGFAVLCGLWALSLLYGFGGVPGLQERTVSTRHSMLLHGATTAAIAALAAGLGSATAHAGGSVPTGTRWLLCGSLGVYFAISTLAGLLTGSGWRWLLGWGLPCTLAAILLGALGAALPAAALVWILAAIIGWQNLYRPLAERRAALPVGEPA
jgi:low temperature requirement protein LtrA